MKIALLEDNAEQAELVTTWLTDASYQVCHFEEGKIFLKEILCTPFDMAILDWELPGMSGLEVLQTMRNVQQQALPVLFCTQRESEDDIVKALRSGADDYLVKPLRKAELLARLDAVRRRAGIASPGDMLTLGPIEIDTAKSEIRIDGVPVKVTQKDFGIAMEFAQNLGKILSRDYLLRAVWGLDVDIHTRTVDVHVSRVRRKLKISPEIGYRIKNIFQHGYRLEKCQESS